jgi:hypothetical protein
MSLGLTYLSQFSLGLHAPIMWKMLLSRTVCMILITYNKGAYHNKIQISFTEIYVVYNPANHFQWLTTMSFLS